MIWEPILLLLMLIYSEELVNHYSFIYVDLPKESDDEYSFIDINIPWNIIEIVPLFWCWRTKMNQRKITSSFILIYPKNQRRSTSLLIFIYPEVQKKSTTSLILIYTKESEKEYNFVFSSLPLVFSPLHLHQNLLTLF